MPTKQAIIEEGTGRGGERRRRAATLVEQLYHMRVINVDEWQAAGTLRNLHCMLTPASEGVIDPTQASGVGNPIGKADRRGRHLTGIEIKANGEIIRGPSTSNRQTRWRYEDAMFAMAGVWTEGGDKVIDAEVAGLMLRAIVSTQDTMTQAEIGALRSVYRSNKQVTASGATFIKENLRRLALHFQLVKGNSK